MTIDLAGGVQNTMTLCGYPHRVNFQVHVEIRTAHRTQAPPENAGSAQPIHTVFNSVLISLINAATNHLTPFPPYVSV